MLSTLSRVLLSSVGGATLFAVGAVVGGGEAPSTGDWMSFAGAMLGASITVLGSVYVLDRERRREDRERRDLLSTLLDEVDEACLPFQMANEAALLKRRGINTRQAVRQLKAAVSRVHQFRDKLEPNTVRMLKISDAIAELTVDNAEIDGLATAAAFYPESADYGALNAIGHEVQCTVGDIRSLLRS